MEERIAKGKFFSNGFSREQIEFKKNKIMEKDKTQEEVEKEVIYNLLRESSDVIKSLRNQLREERIRTKMFDDCMSLFKRNSNGLDGVSSYDIISKIDNYFSNESSKTETNKKDNVHKLDKIKEIIK